MLKVSTGLRNDMLVTDSFKGLMDGGFLKIYSGTEPATADASLGSAVLLVTISVDGGGTGLTWEDVAAAGILSKEGDETWQGTIGASGTASFFRFVTSTDTGALSTTENRLQGTVGVLGAELNLSSIALTASSVQTINHFNVALPTL
jgi:hypothetical protein